MQHDKVLAAADEGQHCNNGRVPPGSLGSRAKVARLKSMSLTGLPEALHVEVQGDLSATGWQHDQHMCSKQAIA